MKYHAAVAAELLGSEELVQGAIDDLETSALPEKDKALLRFVAKTNHRAWEITADDMKPLYAVGWTDEAIYYAVSVCALFNFYNRWIDATGVHAMSDEAHREFGKRTAKHGYNPK
jgi:alkylhydroperoxidase family enzyme